MWQTCPICSGTGKVLADGFTNSFYQTCKACKGKMIISKLTGLPPDYDANRELRRDENTPSNKKEICLKHPFSPDEMF